MPELPEVETVARDLRPRIVEATITGARVAWAHDWVSNPSVGAAFETLPATNFTVYGAPMPQNSALASAGAELFITPRLTVLAKFDGAFAPGSQTYTGTGTLRYTW